MDMEDRFWSAARGVCAVFFMVLLCFSAGRLLAWVALTSLK